MKNTIYETPFLEMIYLYPNDIIMASNTPDEEEEELWSPYV